MKGRRGKREGSGREVGGPEVRGNKERGMVGVARVKERRGEGAELQALIGGCLPPYPPSHGNMVV